MLPLAKTVGYQVLRLGLGLTLILGFFRLVFPNEDIGFMLLTLILSLAVVVVSLQGINVILWWWYTFLWTLGLALLYCFGPWLYTILEPGGLDRIGPGGIVYILPPLTLMFGFPIGGLLRLFSGGKKR
jgi:hypothetical protein